MESAEHALEVCGQHGPFQIALLDIMLPGMDGLELCSILRQDDPRLGIIMLTARTQEQDKIDGFSLGADDYVTKPFSIAELTARVDAVYRRTAAATAEPDDKGEIVSGIFKLDPASRIVSKRGEPLDLTQVEFQLMELFMRNPGVALDRNRILKAVWGDNYFGDIKIVDVNICRIRNKVEEEGKGSRHIATVWGFGYRWNE